MRSLAQRQVALSSMPCGCGQARRVGVATFNSFRLRPSAASMVSAESSTGQLWGQFVGFCPKSAASRRRKEAGGPGSAGGSSECLARITAAWQLSYHSGPARWRTTAHRSTKLCVPPVETCRPQALSCWASSSACGRDRAAASRSAPSASLSTAESVEISGSHGLAPVDAQCSGFCSEADRYSISVSCFCCSPESLLPSCRKGCSARFGSADCFRTH